MAFTGLWVIRRNGALVEIGGRLYWSDRASLERAAVQAGVPLSSDVVHTGRLDADCFDTGGHQQANDRTAHSPSG